MFNSGLINLPSELNSRDPNEIIDYISNSRASNFHNIAMPRLIGVVSSSMTSLSGPTSDGRPVCGMLQAWWIATWRVVVDDGSLLTTETLKLIKISVD